MVESLAPSLEMLPPVQENVEPIDPEEVGTTVTALSSHLSSYAVTAAILVWRPWPSSIPPWHTWTEPSALTVTIDGYLGLV